MIRDFLNQRVNKALFTRLLLFLVVVFSMTALLTVVFTDIPETIEVGSVANVDIRADRDYEIVDEESTNKFRAAALKNVLPVFDFNTQLEKDIASRLHMTFSAIREKYAELSRQEKTDASSDNLLKQLWIDTMGGDISAKQWNLLYQNAFREELSDYILAVLRPVAAKPLVAESERLIENHPQGVSVRLIGGEIGKEGAQSWNADRLKEVISMEVAREKVQNGHDKNDKLNSESKSLLRALAAQFLKANFYYNEAESNVTRESVIKDVKPAIIKLQAGEIIVRRGSRFEKNHVNVINAIHRIKTESSLPMKIIGNFLVVFLALAVILFFGSRFIRKFHGRYRDLVYMATVLLVVMTGVRLFVFMAHAVAESSYLNIPRASFYYAIPVASAAMLIRFVLNSETTTLFILLFSSLTGLYLGQEPTFTIFVLISSLVAASNLSRVDKRSIIIRGGLVTGMVNALCVLAFVLMKSDSITIGINSSLILWYILLAFVGGVGSAVVAMALLPIAENIFGYTTDIKLLEMANLNHPLLRELIIRAPGTYHHSHLVGVLAEAAANAIGANPLLTKVAAYYHDIGKIKKPQYYVENSLDAAARHEKLSPHMSALIVSSHVKEGLELARQHKLPKAISDMIPQHHGTKMVGFFYQKAIQTNNPAMQRIDEKDFRYPGPKPQSREAGILLLADATEATVRALKEKTPSRISQTVRNIVTDSFNEAQLDECDLTLRNLNDIAIAFTHVLTSIYHQRIDYRDSKKEEELAGDPKAAVMGTLNQEAIDDGS